MATERAERPYSQFNFLVSWQASPGSSGDGLPADDPKAGFQEVSGLGMEVTVAEYRAGNSKENAPIKVTNLYKVPDITLKRGVMGYVDVNKWLRDVQQGAQDALKDVTVELLTEDRESTALRWELKNARPIKYTGPTFNGKGTDVAVEELVLACERIELES